MKILIYGAGVIGSIFATKLSLSGVNVTMLALGERANQLRKNGCIIKNPKTNKEEIAKVNVIEKLHSNMYFDYIIVTMQRTQVDSILDILSKNCSKNIVFVSNTASGYKNWEDIIGPNRIMIGFPSAGGEFATGKINYFIGKGLMRIFQTTTFGEVNNSYTSRIKILIKIFKKSGIPSVYCKDMDSWQKTHIAIVTSIANALYKYDCDNKALAKSYRDVNNMILSIKEGLMVLKKNNIEITPRKLLFLKLPSPMLTVIFKIFMKTQLAEITMVKHCKVAKKEMQFLQCEFDEIIKQRKMNTTHIDILRQYLYNNIKE